MKPVRQSERLNPKMAAESVQLTREQFEQLLRTIQPAPQATNTKNFSACTVRFNGEKDAAKVAEFMNQVSLFKAMEGITDENALIGLPLLLGGIAATWWRGYQNQVTSWEEALRVLKTTFAPKRPAYRVYLEVFQSPQLASEPLDEFVCRQRAILAEIPEVDKNESMQLDMIFGLIRHDLRSKMTRGLIKNFTELLIEGRKIEEDIQEQTLKPQIKMEPPGNTQRPKCNFCHLRGHTEDVCRRRKRVPPAKDERLPVKKESAQALACYGCNRPGVMRRNCPTCNKTEETPKLTFCAFQLSQVETMIPRPRASLCISILGEQGLAFFDTGAKTSIASHYLHQRLMAKGASFRKVAASYRYADGNLHHSEVLITTVNVKVKGRTIPTQFVVLPKSSDNRTLLGLDFLEDAGIVLIPRRRAWYFEDSPETVFSWDPSAPEMAHLYGYIDAQIRHPKEPENGDETGKRQKLAHSDEEIHYGPTFETHRLSKASQEQMWRMNKEEFSQLWDTHMDINSFECDLRPDEGTALNLQERQRVNELIHSHQEVFSEIDRPTTATQHVIDTGDHLPIAGPPYRLSVEKTKTLRAEIEEMLDKGIIQESDAPWTSPVVMVPKPGGETRVCIDYRKLNAITKPDCYPLPRIDDLLYNARGYTHMSTIDLRAGYWQIPVRPADREKTTFITPFGTYLFNRMPFGLRNAPASFQRLIDKVKRTLVGVMILAYLDDIILLSKDFESHLRDLDRVFQALRHYQLRAKREKCQFGCTQVKFLGHFLTPTGLAINTEKVAAIMNRPAPRNVKEIQSFLQTCSWFRRFISNFSTVARPLSSLTKKNAPWAWGEEQQTAFTELKKKLTSTPILRQADTSQPFTLRTDASQYALGAVLLQGEGPEEKPIEYASRLLSKAEQNYSTTEREALAIIFGLAKFRGYLEDSTTVVITDHQPLKWLMSIKTPSGRLARWALQLQPYNLSIQYAPGKANVIADTLSRPPRVIDELETNDYAAVHINFPTISSQATRQQQTADPELKIILEALESQNPETAHNWTQRGYMTSQGILYHYLQEEDNDEAQLVIPATLREEILKENHDKAGHYGIERTLQKILRTSYWPNIRKNTRDYVQKCIPCQKYKAANTKPAGLVLTPATNQRFEVISIDLIGPLPETEEGYRWILVIEDIATKWVELFPLKTASAAHCATIMLDEVCLRYGTPRKIISDNGVQFVSAVMQKLTLCMGIEHHLIPVYHPEANPVERKNRDIKTRLAIQVEGDHRTWPDKLPAIRFAMNSTVTSSTNFSPAYLMFGRELRSPGEAHRDFREIIINENFVVDITPKLLKLEETLRESKETMENRQDQRLKYANQKRRISPRHQPDDLVWLDTHVLSNQSKGLSGKLAPKRDGPYRILRARGPTTYEVSNTEDPSIPVGTFHTSQITKYRGPTTDAPKPTHPIRKRGRPRKNAGPIVGTTSRPEGESVTRTTRRNPIRTATGTEELDAYQPPVLRKPTTANS